MMHLLFVGNLGGGGVAWTLLGFIDETKLLVIRRVHLFRLLTYFLHKVDSIHAALTLPL